MEDNLKTRVKRLETVISLGIPDRAPAVPLIAQFALRYRGVPQSDAYRNAQTTIKALVETFDALGGWDGQLAANLICILHFDTDWTLNMPYLKDLPRGKCICELDSRTDIFKAKEILKGHMCIMGDVPATLLSLGTEDEVVNYCNKLHEIVGRDGGFILSTGCEFPIDAKFENVKAMLDTALHHTYSGHN